MKWRGMVVAGAIAAVLVWVAVSNRQPDPVVAATAAARPERQNESPGRDPVADGRQAATRVPDRNVVEGQPAFAAPKPDELSTDTRPPLADRLGAAGTMPEAEPKILLEVLDAYRRMLGAYPAGEDNRQIVNALLGANREHVPFIPFDHPRLKSGGELVDAYGTPFYFHLISRNAIEIRSAGPDHRMYTADDYIAATPASRPSPAIPVDSSPPSG